MEYNLTMKIKTIIISKNGGPEVLELKESNIGRPSQDEVLIEHVAIGLNFIDVYHRSGLYPVQLPSGIGAEGAGIIKEVGSNERTLKLEIEYLILVSHLVLTHPIEFSLQRTLLKCLKILI